MPRIGRSYGLQNVPSQVLPDDTQGADTTRREKVEFAKLMAMTRIKVKALTDEELEAFLLCYELALMYNSADGNVDAAFGLVDALRALYALLHLRG